jgi:LacI family transcriptional regulator
MDMKTGRNSVNLSEIAQQTGFSIATVSKVLNNKSDISDQTRKTINAALQKNDYQRRIPRERNRHQIEVVFQDFDSIWALEILRGIIHEANKHSLTVVTTESGDKHHPAPGWIQGVIRRQPLGVILIFSDIKEDDENTLQQFGINYVVIDPSGNPAPEHMSVQADNWTGGVLATRHLLSLGHRKIGVITGPHFMMCSVARLDGYKMALQEKGIEPEESLMREGDFTPEGGREQGLSLLQKEHPTAIFAGSDLQAMGVYEAARKLSLRIPEDLSVIGFDDVQTSAFMGPTLTTIRQPLQDMGAAAAKMLYDVGRKGKTTKPKRLILPTSLILRNSTQEIGNATHTPKE